MRRSPHGYTCGLRRHHRVGILLRFVLAEGRSPGTWPTHDAIVNCAELTRPGAEGRRCRTKMLTGCAGPCPLLSSSVTRSQITSRSRASGRDRMKLRRARCAVPFYRITTQTSDGFVDEGVLYRRHKALGRRRCQPPGWSAGIDLYHAHQGLRAWIRSMCIEIVMGVGGGKGSTETARDEHQPSNPLPRRRTLWRRASSIERLPPCSLSLLHIVQTPEELLRVPDCHPRLRRMQQLVVLAEGGGNGTRDRAASCAD